MRSVTLSLPSFLPKLSTGHGSTTCTAFRGEPRPLGRTQVKTTERYAHLRRETLLKAANVVANMVGGAIPARAAVTLTHV